MMYGKRPGRINVILIVIALGIPLGALAGFLAGTFELPIAVVIPAVVVPTTVGVILYLKKSQGQ
jgi:hypothetical protein